MGTKFIAIPTAEHFQFLDDLRGSGATNMWGASPFLRDEFDLDKDEAKSILMSWMKSFDPNLSAEDRAKAVRS